MGTFTSYWQAGLWIDRVNCVNNTQKTTVNPVFYRCFQAHVAWTFEASAHSLFGVFGDDGFGDVVRDIGIVVEFHAGAGSSLRGAAKIGSVTEHFT